MSPRAPSIFIASAVSALGLLLARTATPEPLVVTDPSSVNVCGHKLHLLRRGCFALEAAAGEAASALALARLALERFDR